MRANWSRYLQRIRPVGPALSNITSSRLIQDRPSSALTQDIVSVWIVVWKTTFTPVYNLGQNIWWKNNMLKLFRIEIWIVINYIYWETWTVEVQCTVKCTVQSSVVEWPVEDQWRTNQCRLIQPPASWQCQPHLVHLNTTQMEDTAENHQQDISTYFQWNHNGQFPNYMHSLDLQ